MENFDIRKLSQTVRNTTNKVKFCASLAVTALDEDEIDGLSRILEGCAEELEQAANTIELLPVADYAMKKHGRYLQAVPTPLPVAMKEQQPA